MNEISKEEIEQLNLPEQPLSREHIKNLIDDTADMPAGLRRKAQELAEASDISVVDETNVIGTRAHEKHQPNQETADTGLVLNTAAVILLLLGPVSALTDTVHADSELRDYSERAEYTRSEHYQGLKEHWDYLQRKYDVHPSENLKVYYANDGEAVHSIESHEILDELWSYEPTQIIYRSDLDGEDRMQSINNDETALVELDDGKYAEIFLQNPNPDASYYGGDDDRYDNTEPEEDYEEEREQDRSSYEFRDYEEGEYRNWDRFLESIKFGTMHGVRVLTREGNRPIQTEFLNVPDLFDGRTINYVKRNPADQNRYEYDALVKMPDDEGVVGIKTVDSEAIDNRDNQAHEPDRDIDRVEEEGDNYGDEYEEAGEFAKRNDLRRLLQGRDSAQGHYHSAEIHSNLLRYGTVHHAAVGGGIRDRLRNDIQQIDPDDPISGEELAKITQHTSYRIESIDDVRDLEDDSDEVADWLHQTGNLALLLGAAGEAYEGLTDEDVDTEFLFEVAGGAKGAGWLQEAMTSSSRPLPELEANQAAFAIGTSDPSTDVTNISGSEYKLVILDFEETDYHND